MRSNPKCPLHRTLRMGHLASQRVSESAGHRGADRRWIECVVVVVGKSRSGSQRIEIVASTLGAKTRARQGWGNQRVGGSAGQAGIGARTGGGLNALFGVSHVGKSANQEASALRFVVSHPWRKNRARQGWGTRRVGRASGRRVRAVFLFRSQRMRKPAHRDLWHPTLGAKTRARQGWGTRRGSESASKI